MAEIEWDTPAFACVDEVNVMGENIDTIEKNTQTLLDASRVVGV
jgi:hypothetical protein